MYSLCCRLSKLSLLLAITLLSPCTLSIAETIIIPIGSQQSSQNLPQRGETQQAVKQQYGQAQKVTSTVGKPPISIWHYPSFSVYFESNIVIHAVAHHKPRN